MDTKLCNARAGLVGGGGGGGGCRGVQLRYFQGVHMGGKGGTVAAHYIKFIRQTISYNYYQLP